MSIQTKGTLRNEQDRTLVVLKLLPEHVKTIERKPKHLAILLDSSGSMVGDRIRSVKDTMHLLTDALPSKDILTIIQYSSESTILIEAKPMSQDRSEIHSKIDTIEADCGTNLESAFLCLSAMEKKDQIDSVFILTDGHINEGLTSSRALLGILRSSIPNDTPVNTLGYGTDYNSRLLKIFSVHTCGSHTFADTEELLPAIIGDILGGLSSEVGRNCKVRIPEGWKCLELGYEPTSPKYHIGVLIAEKEQWVVLEGPPETTIDTIAVSFNDGTKSVESVVVLEKDSISDIEIYEQLHRTQVAFIFGQAVEELEHGHKKQAKHLLKELQVSLGTSIAKDTKFVIQLQAQVDEMLEAIQHSFISELVPRMVSNTVALGMQRGILSRLRSVQPNTGNRELSGIQHSFSSPKQRATTKTMSDRYSKEMN